MKDSELEAKREKRLLLRALFAGVIGLVVAMGVGRFAFTPLLPVMQQEAGLSKLLAGQLASWNFLGYLVGALGLTFLTWLRRFKGLYPLALAVSCLSTAGMGLTDSPLWWSVLRGLGGAASALIFIALSAQLIPYLYLKGQSRGAVLLYSGVGLGIVLTGVLTPPLTELAGWRGGWIGLGLLAAGLSWASWRLLQGVPAAPKPPETPAARARASKSRGLGLLAAAYFLEGLGYVVTATFLVAMVKDTPGLTAWASASWVAVGLCAAPAALLWQSLALSWGWRRATTCAYLVQALSLYASRSADGPIGLLLSAAAFGATFMGVTALSMSEGTRRAGDRQRRVASILTAVYALGQIIGPLVAGWLAQNSGDFRLSLALASGCIALGGLLTWLDPVSKNLSDKEKHACRT